VYDLRPSRRWLWRVPSSGMWRRVDLVWTDVSEERIASIIRIKNSRARNQREQVAADSPRIFLPLRWRRYVPPKRRFTQDLHGITSQKTAFFLPVLLAVAWSPDDWRNFDQAMYSRKGWADVRQTSSEGNWKYALWIEWIPSRIKVISSDIVQYLLDELKLSPRPFS
jgi:hypothetical protein